MKFSNICIITENVSRLARFYETIFKRRRKGLIFILPCLLMEPV